MSRLLCWLGWHNFYIINPNLKYCEDCDMWFKKENTMGLGYEWVAKRRIILDEDETDS